MSSPRRGETGRGPRRGEAHDRHRSPCPGRAPSPVRARSGGAAARRAAVAARRARLPRHRGRRPRRAWSGAVPAQRQRRAATPRRRGGRRWTGGHRRSTRKERPSPRLSGYPTRLHSSYGTIVTAHEVRRRDELSSARLARRRSNSVAGCSSPTGAATASITRSTKPGVDPVRGSSVPPWVDKPLRRE